MHFRTPVPRSDAALDVESVAGRIAEIQRSDGEIPWHPGGKTDPWDHVEAAMGLTVAGLLAEARRAYRWLAARQNTDGSWFSAYRQGRPVDRTRESHLAAYLAVGVFHYHRVTGDRRFLEEMWPSAARAVDFALGLQAPGGEIHWARSPRGDVDPMALLTGSSSVFMSLKCAIAVSQCLGVSRPDWHRGCGRLAHAIGSRPQHFNMAKARFSMDWFYPILCGAIRGERAQRRIDRQWKKFVINGQGVRCVSDQPWITLAETAELALTLAAMGNRDQARTVFSWMADKRNENGTYWCGYTYPDMTIWPEEETTWTDAAVLLAADALYGLTPAADLFDHAFWNRQDVFATDRANAAAGE